MSDSAFTQFRDDWKFIYDAYRIDGMNLGK